MAAKGTRTVMLTNLGVVLASSSPRRAEILASLGIPFVVDPADVDETVRPGESGEDAASRLAAAKASAVVSRRAGDWVLAADTLVLLDGEILGKPRDDAEAADMLGKLASREHRVVTAVRLRRGDDPGREIIELSGVRISPLSPEEIRWYVATGEPRDKAGAYAVQGLGARFIEAVHGSYTNVMGLPARAVYSLLRDSGETTGLALPR
jgi:nucleoside triphosphate pyrophosphatase